MTTAQLGSRIVARFLQASGMQIGDTYEAGTLRAHRYADTIVLWDLTNAGKRGKTVRRFWFSPSHKSNAPLNLDGYAKGIAEYSSYDTAKAFVLDVLHDFPGGLETNERTERGVDVVPAGFKKRVIKTPHIEVSVGYKEFSVRDLDDRNNEPTCIPAINGGVKSIPVFYRWVTDNEESIKHMKYRDVLLEMQRLGVRYHDYCAMD
jgi:hypothetical protein